MYKYFTLMRVKHYVKNFLIFLPLIFAGQLFDTPLLLNVIFGFISFSLVASIVYIVNDIHDLENDKRHQTKRKRPLAAGEISIRNAIILAVVLGFLAATVNFIFNNTFMAWCLLLLYGLINFLYSCGLKKIPLVDITIIGPTSI